MLIAEDLLLLLTDDQTGKLSASPPMVDLALAGANLVELTLMNKVDLTHEEDGKPGRLVVRDSTPVGDPILDAALVRLRSEEGKKPEAAVKALAKGLREKLYERLAERGVLRSEHTKVFGLFPRHTWPAADARHEAEVRRSVTEAFTEPSPPEPHAAALIALIHALRCEHEVIDIHELGLSKEQVKARAVEISSGTWASEAVRSAIEAMLAAVIAATTAATSTVVLPGAR